MNKLNIIRALSYRAWLGTFADKGRIVDMLLFPVSHLTIWGLFLYIMYLTKGENLNPLKSSGFHADLFIPLIQQAIF